MENIPSVRDSIESLFDTKEKPKPKPKKASIISVEIPTDIITQLDILIEQKYYKNRSDVIRAAIRNFLREKNV